MMLRTFSAFSLIASASVLGAFAAYGQNLINCEGQPGVLVKKCAITPDRVLAEQQPFESDFIVSYKLTCNRNYRGPKPSFLSASLESGQRLDLQYNFEGQDILVGTGMGPLVLSDSKPVDLLNMQFNSCELNFTKVETRPSARVQAQWDKAAQDYENILAVKEQKQSALTQLASKMSDYAGGQEGLYCLYVESEKDPKTPQALLEKIRNQYENIYGVFTADSLQCSANEPQKFAANVAVCTSNPDDLTPFCMAYEKYQSLLAWYDRSLALIAATRTEQAQIPAALRERINQTEKDMAAEQEFFRQYLQSEQGL